MGEEMENMRKCFPARDDAGFTLVELLVVMVVFVVVIMIASDSFKTILTRTTILSRSAESNIEGIVGLEMFRHDLNQAGFGLPWGFSGATPPDYDEAATSPASAYNDKDATGVLPPRAIVAGNDLDGAATGVLDRTDYLVLKATTLAQNRASQRWTYVNYSSTGKAPKTWSSGNFTSDDNVIVLRRVFLETGYVNELQHDGDTFSQKYSDEGFSNENFRPVEPQETYYVYGVSTGSDGPRMPFNRTDYYVKRPDSNMPAQCAENTGILYKAVVNKDGDLTPPIPILDCVGDMQVVFGWDMDDDGVAEVLSNADGSAVNNGGSAMITNVQAAMSNAAAIRDRLKFIKVYLLVQDGRKDPNFKNKSAIAVGNRDLGEVSLTREYTVEQLEANEWNNYRWKVYRIVVSPKNLTLN